MKKLIVYYGDSPLYAEGFPKDCKRSCKGSLHLTPRKPKTVTDDELAYLRKAYKEAKRIKVVAEKVEDRASKKEAKKAVEAKANAAKPSSPKEASKEKKDDTKKKSGKKKK